MLLAQCCQLRLFLLSACQQGPPDQVWLRVVVLPQVQDVGKDLTSFTSQPMPRRRSRWLWWNSSTHTKRFGVGKSGSMFGEDQVQRGTRVNWIGTEFSAGLDLQSTFPFAPQHRRHHEHPKSIELFGADGLVMRELAFSGSRG